MTQKSLQVNLTNKHLQFNVSLDEESETCALTAKNIKTSTLSLDTVAAFVQVMLREDLCLLFQWIQNGPPASDRTPTIQNGNNLTLEKNHQGWQESLSKWQSGVHKHSLNLYDLSYSLNFKAVVFYLYEVTWTFLNTRTCTYKKDDKPRSFCLFLSMQSHHGRRSDNNLIETSPVSTALDRNVFVRRSHHSIRKIT